MRHTNDRHAVIGYLALLYADLILAVRLGYANAAFVYMYLIISIFGLYLYVICNSDRVEVNFFIHLAVDTNNRNRADAAVREQQKCADAYNEHSGEKKYPAFIITLKHTYILIDSALLVNEHK